jgi:hypothetical protein
MDDLSKRGYIVNQQSHQNHAKAKDSKIANLIKFAIDNDGEYAEINFGIMPNSLAQQINQASGIRSNGATRILSSYTISHILKSHGNGTNQESRGQKTITPADIELIPSIFSSPDEFQFGGVNSKGKNCILFKKKISQYDYHLVACLSIKNDRDRGGKEVKLFVNTLYAKK